MPGRAVAGLIAGTTAIRLLLAWAVGLGIDESYMVAAGRDLRLGYFDHPPLSWWLSSGIVHLTGSEAPVVVRLPFIVLFAVSTWLMYRLAATLFTPRAGVWAAVALNLAPVLGLTTASWVLPDGPLVCALLAAALCLVHALEGRGTAWWLGAGVAAGLALLSKYSAGLVLGGAFIALLTQPAHRHWLARPQPYLAAALALLVFSPVLVWNAQHGWASFAFQGGRAGGASFRPFGPIATLAGEALFLLPWIWLGLMIPFVRGLRAGPADWRRWLLCWLAAGPIVLFAVVSLWTRSMLFHWATPGYLFLFPLLGDWLDRWRQRRVRAWAQGTAILTGVVLVLAVTEVRFNWLSAFKPGFDPALQGVDLTPLRPVLAARGLLNGPAIAAPSWNDTGKVDYALGGHPRVLCLNLDARQYGFSPGPGAHIGEDMLIVAPRQNQARIEASYGKLFDSIEPLEPARLEFPGRGTVEVPLFLARHLKRWP
ncbi:glycosyltransferase family 39 protein [Limobrevibacterium gyesilva]|uniref:Glycosyltransferase family 39 protein n=1 Tax=Limobrevibacterium gyesilva TaxID=2991712 RepID=A0AA42CD07_9PROT|nr:glycosyltransferase family 39 protein [Limobrevibacterium gyesilva]MCW3473059.1 glycosyltransferase family 39 protein [Limobrevibacterium gyesilva]